MKLNAFIIFLPVAIYDGKQFPWNNNSLNKVINYIVFFNVHRLQIFWNFLASLEIIVFIL